MSDTTIKLSGTYDSIEAYKILQDMQNLATNYNTVYTKAVEAEGKAETLTNTATTAVNTATSKASEASTYATNASTSATNAKASEDSALASKDIAVSSAGSASTSATNANTAYANTQAIATQFASDISGINTQLESLSSGKVNKANPVDNNGYAMETVVASGTNYIRYASGLQICWGSYSIDGNTLRGTNTFAVEFKSGTKPSITAIVDSTNGNYMATFSSLSNTKTDIASTRYDCNYSMGRAGYYIAIGRWK